MIDNYEKEFEDWLVFERTKKSTRKNFVGDRAYRHLDGRISRKDDLETGHKHRLISELKNPNHLAQHSFFPFLRRDKKTRRFMRKYVNSKKIIGKDGVKIEAKNRPIMYASHQDACIYGFYAYMLKIEYDKQISSTSLDRAVIAYRRIARDDNSGRNKSNVDFAKDVYDAVTTFGECAVMCLDIKGFFDKMRHDNIERSWKNLLGYGALPPGHKIVFKQITNYRYIFLGELLEKMGEGKIVKGRFKYSKGAKKQGIIGPIEKYNQLVNGTSLIHKNRSIRGIPQGSPISDIIANIYLRDFDQSLINRLKQNNRISLYKRYSDDMLIVCDQKEAVATYEYIKKLLAHQNIDLTLKENKTELFFVNANTGMLEDRTLLVNPKYSKNKKTIQYLGFEFDLEGMNIRSGTIANHYRKIAQKKKNRDKKPERSKENHKGSKHQDVYQYFKQSVRKTQSRRTLRQFRRVTKRTNSLLR